MVTYAEERSCITQFELGELFHKGEQRSRDYAEAFRWYKNAAIKGSRPAQNRLGAMYARGQGVNQDYAKAYAWCKVAAFQNSKRAQRMLRHIENKMCLEELRRGRWLGQEYYDRFVARRLHSLADADNSPRRRQSAASSGRSSQSRLPQIEKDQLTRRLSKS